MAHRITLAQEDVQRVEKTVGKALDELTECSQGADVVLYTIDGGGHNWPGVDLLPGFDFATKDVIATDVIWEFFEAHPQP